MSSGDRTAAVVVTWNKVASPHFSHGCPKCGLVERLIGRPDLVLRREFDVLEVNFFGLDTLACFRAVVPSRTAAARRAPSAFAADVSHKGIPALIAAVEGPEGPALVRGRPLEGAVVSEEVSFAVGFVNSIRGVRERESLRALRRPNHRYNGHNDDDGKRDREELLGFLGQSHSHLAFFFMNRRRV